ncbi:crossover junction endodeoxyribonuclease RuvC [Salibacter halophilus]|uniref:Crossover junction endodeoxyribonuclease RuvC n=1 Tax=Salibacter halophilus TaxID=1803916 RepID=A0A6N6M3L5_9FLAO|nr:crossover junction endodeoxyribonuclease RuvC [Salibacter halophilus]KAB1063819.1 crossover junction endodeoxyribonuclease RuvC [Salibacter halophilus]
MQKAEQIILGIDPGTTITGYGIIVIRDKKMELVQMGEIHLKKLNNQAQKLKKIFERTLNLIDEYHPDELAIEAPFFGKNVQSMLKLGRAQGVAIAAAVYRDIPMTEYSPRKIKQSITGSGSASKEQVAKMLQKLLKIEEEKMPKHLDATDGLSVAVCHHFQGGAQGSDQNKYKGWGSFISQNPGKIK